jgi:hypothetical protein
VRAFKAEAAPVLLMLRCRGTQGPGKVVFQLVSSNDWPEWVSGVVSEGLGVLVEA